MKIISLRSENIKRLSVVEIVPDGNVVQITGPNESGKSSILDSIWWAITGNENVQVQPIRAGQESARIRLDLGEYVVTKRFKEGQPPTIKVETTDGAAYGSPQKLLDSLLSSLTFDPLAFTKLKPADQYAVIRRTVKLDVDIDALDKANKEDFTTRTEVNRDAKNMRSQAAGIMVTPGLPEAPVDTAALVAKIASAGEHNAQITIAANRISERAQQLVARDETAKELGLRVDALRRQMEAAASDVAVFQTQTETLAKEVLPTPGFPIDVDELQGDLADANSINDAIRARVRRAEIEKSAEEAEARAAALTTAMDARTAEKEAAIAAAEMPVDGLSFGSDILLYNGVPFEQASTSIQLRVSCAIAAASAPKLRVVMIRDGSALDSKNLAALAEWATEKDMQIWLEKVDESGTVGIVMEDGHVKGQTLEPTEEPAPRKRSKAAAKPESPADDKVGDPPAPKPETPIAPRFDL